MLAGAGGIDLALLVVAADDGVMPQTREHLAILSLLGISRGIVALTKADLADVARQAEVIGEIGATLSGTPLADAPVVPVSALTGVGVEALRRLLAEAEAATTVREAVGPFRLAVDRSFTLSGAGTVVTGTVLTGRAAAGDRVVISPTGLAARVRSIHAQNRPAEAALAGLRCALNLAGDGVTKEAVGRGDVALLPELHAPTDRIDAELSVLATEPKPIGTWFPARLHSHATEVGARIVPLAGPIEPGGRGLVQLVLDRPIAVAALDRFILRDVSASRTLGGGRFLDLRPPARNRGTPERLALLSAAGEGDPACALRMMADVAPVDLPSFFRDRSLAPDASLLAGVVTIGDRALSARSVATLSAGLAETLTAFHAENPDHPGIGREKLRLSLVPRLPKDVFLIFLRREAAAGRAVLDGAFVHLPGHAVVLSPDDEAHFALILPGLLGEARFRPPRVRDFAAALGAAEADVRRVLKLTQRLGRTDQIALDHFFARPTTREMAVLARQVADDEDSGWFSAAAFRDRMDNGRKVTIQILEFFHRHGVTLRRGDLRRINPHRADQFGDGDVRESSPVGRPDFNSGWGSEPVLGGFDSRSLPPAGPGAPTPSQA